MGYLELFEGTKVRIYFEEDQEFCQEQNINVIFSPVGDHRATVLVERLFRTIEERLMVMEQGKPKPSLELALMKIIKGYKTVTA